VIVVLVPFVAGSCSAHTPQGNRSEGTSPDRAPPSSSEGGGGGAGGVERGGGGRRRKERGLYYHCSYHYHNCS